MTNQEAIEVLKNPSKAKCYVLDKAISMAIEALEKLYGDKCPMCEGCPHGCKLEVE